jgi:hypothetical protein
MCLDQEFADGAVQCRATIACHVPNPDGVCPLPNDAISIPEAKSGSSRTTIQHGNYFRSIRLCAHRALLPLINPG